MKKEELEENKTYFLAACLEGRMESYRVIIAQYLGTISGIFDTKEKFLFMEIATGRLSFPTEQELHTVFNNPKQAALSVLIQFKANADKQKFGAGGAKIIS